MSTLQLTRNATTTQALWHHGVIVPFHAIKKWSAVFLITSGTLYASAMFNMQHGVFPPEVAFPLAVGIEWIYLSGLAYATELRSNRWSVWMIGTGAVTSGLYGILYMLGRYGVIPASPDPALATLLSIAHVVPLIGLLFIFTLCKRDHAIEQREYGDQQRRREETLLQHTLDNQIAQDKLQFAQAQEQRDRESSWKDHQLANQAELDRLKLDQERSRLDRLNARATKSATRLPQPVAPQPVVIDGVSYPSITAAADAHGITRQAMTKRLRATKAATKSVRE